VPADAGWQRDAKVIGIVATAHFVSHVYIMLLPPIFLLVKDHFGVDYTDIALALTAYNVMSALLQTPAGFLVDRIGARVMLTLGLILSGIAICVSALLPGYWAFLIGYALLGVANTVFHPADYSILSATVDGKRMGKAFSVHTFAGINMAFWPLGTVLRRAGRIFIRRDMKDAVVYRWVLRQYLGYLVEKRFTLEWYIEGTRSRSGKLGPPKMGLLRYIVDAVREGRADDVAMVPVSIVYDELHEVAEYAREARGAPKESESLAWMVKNFRAQRRHRLRARGADQRIRRLPSRLPAHRHLRRRDQPLGIQDRAPQQYGSECQRHGAYRCVARGRRCHRSGHRRRAQR